MRRSLLQRHICGDSLAYTAQGMLLHPFQRSGYCAQLIICSGSIDMVDCLAVAFVFSIDKSHFHRYFCCHSNPLLFLFAVITLTSFYSGRPLPCFQYSRTPQHRQKLLRAQNVPYTNRYRIIVSCNTKKSP